MAHEVWLEKFTAVGAHMTPEGYASLFAPDGTLTDAGSLDALPQKELADHMQQLLDLIPDLWVLPVRARSRGDTVFIEAANRGTIGGQLVEWPAVYVATLRDAAVIRGRRYYDRLPFAEAIIADLPQPPAHQPQALPDLLAKPNPRHFEPQEFVTQYAEHWRVPDPQVFPKFYATDGKMNNPGFERPLTRAEIPGYYAFLFGILSNASMKCLDWAGDSSTVFIEWELTGKLADKPISTRAADRFFLVDGQAVDGRGYFDRLGLLESLIPDLSARLDASRS